MLSQYKVYIVSTVLMVGVCGSGVAQAATTGFPSGCRDMGYAFNSDVLVLSPEAKPGSDRVQTLYFVYNTSHRGVYMEADVDKRDKYAARYANTIQGQQWGVLAVSSARMIFRCSSESYGDRDLVPCGDVVRLCQYNNVKFGETNQGTYWVVPSQSRQQAIRQTAREGGILLKN